MRYAEILGAEVLKLKRSQVWAVVVVLPLVMAALGVVNTAASGAGLEDGWNTLWLRTTVFFGLFPLALGVAVLASLVWRPEHRGGNWNALMASATPTGRIVVAKTVAVAALGIAMLAVELVAVVILGKLLFGLPGMLPTQYVAVGALTAIAVIPLAALQSTLSMTMRSFAAPIAVAMVGAGVAVVAMTAEWHAAVFVFPYAVTTRASQLASGAFGDPGALTTGAATAVVTAAVLLAGVVVAATTRLLDRRDVHTR